jgi:hypothetical protein
MPVTDARKTEERCPQCWAWKAWPKEFLGKRGAPIGLCTVCQGRYANYGNRTAAEKIAAVPPRVDPKTTGRVLFTLRSGNAKTGPIPVSISERGTCPPSCSLFRAGCYASYGKLGAHWRGVGTSSGSWIPFEAFLGRVRSLPEGSLWRHNEAGDLAGEGEDLDREALRALVAANRGRRGFTFTHKTHTRYTNVYKRAIAAGFTVNLSADSLKEADRLQKRGLPTVVLLPADAPDRGIKTPGGHAVVVCPAQTSHLTCASCQLCAKPFRHSIVGFKAHGQSKALIPEIVRQKRTAI